jgi:hypothetical protein
MARSSPEKLAAALRANLKRRKDGPQNPPEPPSAAGQSESPAHPANAPSKPGQD